MSSPAPATTPSRLYRGVRLEPDGRWAAHVTEGELEGRLIGRFDSEARAALAHDRVAVSLGAPLAHGRVNFPPSFSPMELLFLRRRCAVEFVLLAAADDAYDMAFEDFLRAEFEEYRCGEAGEETARAVAEYAAREGPAWRRVAHNPGDATHRFVFGHINPVMCSSWVALFHDGDPDRSYFTCEEAHEWEVARRAFEREAAARRASELEAAAQKVAVAPELPLDGAERGEEERPPPDSSPGEPGRVSSAPWGSLKRWLRRTFSDEQRELQVPLLQGI